VASENIGESGINGINGYGGESKGINGMAAINGENESGMKISAYHGGMPWRNGIGENGSWRHQYGNGVISNGINNGENNGVISAAKIMSGVIA
jgi:hypothetical protein